MKLLARPLNREIKRLLEKPKAPVRIKIRINEEKKVKFETSISKYFGDLLDRREEGKVRHKLIDIITIALCGVICGANTWIGIETYGKAKEEWLSSFLELPNGIPSHDTINKVFNSLSPNHFQACFIKWMKGLVKLMEGEVVAIDGKRLRRSYDKKSNKKAIEMVSAWASENQIVLGQINTADKSNEITAIPELIKLLDIRSCVVTTDAAGCQKNIASEIIEGGADYVLALKGNQGTLHQDVVDYFEYAEKKGFEGIEHQYLETLDAGHGRIETRRYWTVSNIDWLDNKDKWANLKNIGMVEAKRELNDKTTVERRFFITSLDNQINSFAQAVRKHWHIENSLHWSLDVSFNEDYSRIRQGQGAENFAVLRHIALSLLKRDKTRKASIPNKRLYAALNHNYLFNLLTQV